MDYLKCVVKETLRLHPSLPLLVPRETATNLKWRGYDIPAKTRVFVNAWAIQRDPQVWDNPEDFLPDRFVNNTVDLNGQNFQFIPFGAGRRGCPGISFALAAIEYVIANLLYWFDWKLPRGEVLENLDMIEVSGLDEAVAEAFHGHIRNLQPIVVKGAHTCSIVNKAEDYSGYKAGDCSSYCILLRVDKMSCQLAPVSYLTTCARDS
ncbi:hypothetical protein KPL70_006852 [Citrus sinensis]|nr:hypothetical protein KPL70_006852 [Citrus sinensis]